MSEAELQAECERLRDALRPFAEFADLCDTDHWPGRYHDSTPIRLSVDSQGQYGKAPTLGDCRAARAAMEGKG